MTATMGQNKGKRGEREIKDAFITVMLEAEAAKNKQGVSDKVKRNTLQADQGGDDIVGIPLISVEVKRQETLSVNTWWKQCCASAMRDKLQPVLIYRQNRKSWRVVTWVLLHQPKWQSTKWVRADMDFADWLPWYRALYAEWLDSQL